MLSSGRALSRAPSAEPGRSWLYGGQLRAVDRYELVSAERLDQEQRRDFTEHASADSYGLLVPRSADGGTAIAVSCDVALLLLTVAVPGPLPWFAARALDRDAEARLTALIADGILEVRIGDAFVSGAKALAALRLCRPATGEGRLDQLSLRALDLAACLEPAEARAAAEFLYRYNTSALSPSLVAVWTSPEGVHDHLSLTALTRRMRLSGFEERADHAVWLAWVKRRSTPAANAGPAYKLYVSPTPSDLAKALPVVLDTLRTSSAIEVKVGKTAASLHRPDKLVAYFDDATALQQAAAALLPRLDGIAAQGVPFTAPIDAAGLLSWGIDPPGIVSDPQVASYRQWIIERLALALTTARNRGDDDPVGFALQRLELDGVDISCWKPSLRSELTGLGR